MKAWANYNSENYPATQMNTEGEEMNEGKRIGKPPATPRMSTYKYVSTSECESSPNVSLSENEDIYIHTDSSSSDESSPLVRYLNVCTTHLL